MWCDDRVIAIFSVTLVNHPNVGLDFLTTKVTKQNTRPTKYNMRVHFAERGDVYVLVETNLGQHGADL